MKTILIVEDNEAIIKGLKYLLEQEQFQVIACKSIEETMNIIGKQDIDLVVLDITLPDGSGYEMCEYIKKYTNTPIIFLTARDEEQDVVKGFELGADDYVIKPFRIRELISAINDIFFLGLSNAYKFAMRKKKKLLIIYLKKSVKRLRAKHFQGNGEIKP